MDYKIVYPIEILNGMSRSGNYVLMIADPDQNKALPLVITEQEAQAIVAAQEGMEDNPPSTHALLHNIMTNFMLVVREARIDSLVDGVFYATLVMTDGINEHTFACRAGDAMVVSVGTGCPVKVNPKVIEEAGGDLDALTHNISTRDLANAFATESLEELQQKLKECEANEDYEKAALIQARIDKLTK